MKSRLVAFFVAGMVFAGTGAYAQAPKVKSVINPPPTARDWSDISKLPDWSGAWNPKISDQDAQIKTNMPPWTPPAAELITFQRAEERAGRPPPLFTNCLPEAMPAWMLVTHNSMEILFTPGRVTLLGESDSARLRRIYTDGRAFPEDPDPTFHGYSIGHWEGDVLVVETRAVHPQTLIAISEAAGVPNDGDMIIKERIHQDEKNKDILLVEMEISAPKVLTKPWKTTRVYFRQRARIYEIIEGVCQEGYFKPGKDKYGNDIFLPVEQAIGGNRVPPK